MTTPPNTNASTPPNVLGNLEVHEMRPTQSLLIKFTPCPPENWVDPVLTQEVLALRITVGRYRVMRRAITAAMQSVPAAKTKIRLDTLQAILDDMVEYDTAAGS